MSLQAKTQMLPTDQAIVYPSWMEILQQFILVDHSYTFI